MTAGAAHLSASRNSQMRAEAVAGYTFATPALLLIILLLIAPIVVVFLLSLTDYQLGALDWSWVGLGNYAEIFSDRIFLRSLGNTFIYVAIVVPGSVILGLVVAILVHERTKSKAIYQTIFFLPVCPLARRTAQPLMTVRRHSPGRLARSAATPPGSGSRPA
jgi:multiple sugar transport system permease protein